MQTYSKFVVISSSCFFKKIGFRGRSHGTHSLLLLFPAESIYNPRLEGIPDFDKVISKETCHLASLRANILQDFKDFEFLSSKCSKKECFQQVWFIYNESTYKTKTTELERM